jgi:hypothetical protein
VPGRSSPQWVVDTKDSTTDSVIEGWSDSQVREYLVDHGIISPASTHEQLVLLAKHKAADLRSAVGRASGPEASAASLASQASTAAHSAASAVQSGVRSAASYAARSLDDARDYVFSDWSDSDLTGWLRVHDVLPSPQPTARHDLLRYVRDAYTKLSTPVYKAWSNSYLHEWLEENGIVSPPQTAREKLLELMEENYYDAKDKVYTNWKEATIRQWLVKEGVM